MSWNSKLTEVNFNFYCFHSSFMFSKAFLIQKHSHRLQFFWLPSFINKPYYFHIKEHSKAS